MASKWLLIRGSRRWRYVCTETLFSVSRWCVWVQLAAAQLVWIKQSLLHLTDWAQDKEGLRG